MILYGTVLIAVLVVDQLTKGWIVNTFGLYESREVVAGLFNLVYVTTRAPPFRCLPPSIRPCATTSS